MTIMDQAIRLFGSEEEARLWLSKPSMGLNGKIPTDLLKSKVGTKLIEKFLKQLEYGVYI